MAEDDDDDGEEVDNEENNTSNTTETTNLTRPGEDTTAAAATAADPIEPKYIFGPKGKLPENITSVLEEWHKKYPRIEPPCSLRYAKVPRRPWKVFDRSGKELSFSMFIIKKPIQYHITLIDSEDEPAKLL